MHPVRKQRLITTLFIVLAGSGGIGLVIFALGENMNLFYPPSKIVGADIPLDRTIRAGGCVVPGSILRDDDSLKVQFTVTDGMASLPVKYEGILPDLFGEGEATVLTGKLSAAGVFEATKVLAKHDENYVPREVADTLAEGQEEGGYTNHAKTCGVISYDT